MSFEWVEPASKFATVGAFIFTGITFGITFWRTRKSEQIRIASEFSRNLDEVDDKIQNLSAMPHNESERKNRYIQYLNQWEFFSLLVNKGEITNKHIQEYFRPSLIRDYETIFSKYKDLETEETEYQELKKWKDLG